MKRHFDVKAFFEEAGLMILWIVLTTILNAIANFVRIIVDGLYEASGAIGKIMDFFAYVPGGIRYAINISVFIACALIPGYICQKIYRDDFHVGAFIVAGIYDALIIICCVLGFMEGKETAMYIVYGVIFAIASFTSLAR